VAEESAGESPLEVADALGQLAGGMSAIHREVLSLVAVADRRGDWRDDGASDMPAWLCQRFGLNRATACEWVRVAHALESLPECARAYGEGRLAWDQLRPLTLFATPERDAELAVEAAGCSAAFLEARARRARRVTAEEAEREQERRSVRMWNSRDGFRLAAQLPAADGAVLRTALERIAEQQVREDSAVREEPYSAQLGDALVGLASTRLAADAPASRACVVVHVDAAALARDSERGSAVLEGDVPVHVEVARRLACDGRLELVAEGPDGVALGVGRARRTIPAWLMRQLRRRDGGRCRFPGCNHTRWLQGHHIFWWEWGGRTDMDNLCLLCTACHTKVHELGWTITGNANRELTFRRPDGRVLANSPPPLRPDVRAELLQAVACIDLDA